MDTFKHALIVRSANGRGLTGTGISGPNFAVTGGPGDVITYLNDVASEGWALVAVEPAAQGETRYWLRAPAS